MIRKKVPDFCPARSLRPICGSCHGAGRGRHGDPDLRSGVHRLKSGRLSIRSVLAPPVAMRFVMGPEGPATRPIPTREIAIQVMKGRGLNPEDAAMLLMIRKRVAASVCKSARQGDVRELPSERELKARVGDGGVENHNNRV